MPIPNPSTRRAAVPADTATYRFSFFRSIDAAGHDWDLAAPEHDLFLQRAYLTTLEHNAPVGMRFGYLVFYRGDAPVGVALCQVKFFKGDDTINDLNNASACPGKDPCFFTGLASSLKRWVAGRVAADILICGNLLLTGEHGYWFDYSRISEAHAATLLEAALGHVILRFEREGVRMPVTLVKDIAPERRHQGNLLEEKGFVEFEIQPNMVLDLSYRDFDHYLSAMSTKYRTRAKRAFKKLDGIVKKELTLPEIQRELPRIYDLYRDIARNAGFNMVDLNVHYLPALKRDLPRQFRLFAYYLDGELVAYYTTIVNGEELEAHFLGYDKARNHDFQLYLNILYDIARIAFESGCRRVIFARTALEIKSSVGAVAHDLYCYLRHRHPLTNRFTGTLLDYLKPVEVWQPRHPFKEHEE